VYPSSTFRDRRADERDLAYAVCVHLVQITQEFTGSEVSPATHKYAFLAKHLQKTDMNRQLRTWNHTAMLCRQRNKKSRKPYLKVNTSNSALAEHAILTYRKLGRVKDAPYFLTTRSSQCAIFMYEIRRGVEIFLAKVATSWRFFSPCDICHGHPLT
jgi:hypothetical protein